MPAHVVTTVDADGTVASVNVQTNFAEESGLSATTEKDTAFGATKAAPEAILEYLIAVALRLQTGEQRQDLTHLRDALLQLKAERLRQQLAEIEVEIKTLLAQIAAAKRHEDENRDAAKRAAELGAAVMKNLKAAAEAYAAMMNAAHLDP